MTPKEFVKSKMDEPQFAFLSIQVYRKEIEQLITEYVNSQIPNNQILHNQKVNQDQIQAWEKQINLNDDKFRDFCKTVVENTKSF